MVRELGKLFALNMGRKKNYSGRVEEWFRIEYGKEWRCALAHYRETGSIHWN